MKISLQIDKNVGSREMDNFALRWVRLTSEILNDATAIKPTRDITVQFSPTFPVPFTYNQSNQALIGLSINDLKYWAQIAFQFSHEYCHYLINSPINPQPKGEWFEEVICECASRFTLLRLNEDDMAKLLFNGSFKEYGLNRQKARAKHFSLEGLNDSPLLEHLRTNHEDRLYFNYIANLIMPIINKDDSFWESIPGLAYFKDDNTFLENLNVWYERSPENAKPQVDEIINLFR